MIYDWPHAREWTPVGSIFKLRSISTLSSSPLTGSHKAASLGQVWVADLTFGNRHEDFAREMQGFLSMLEGPVNPVRLFDWWREGPILLSDVEPWSDGTLFDDGTGWLDGLALKLIQNVAKGSRVFVVDGFPVSAEVLRRGDLIGLQGYLYEVRYGVTSNADGEAAITVQPGARLGGAIGDPVSTFRPTVPMRLASDSDASMYRALNVGEGFTLRFVEDIP